MAAAVAAVFGALLMMSAAIQVIIVIMSEGTVTEEDRDSMCFLYFKMIDELEKEIDDKARHPGRGHAAYGFRNPNNPLPKVNMCHFYKLVPDMFQTLCGLSPTEFDDLLGLVRVQMLRPRNGFCTFTDAEQAARRTQVLSSMPFRYIKNNIALTRYAPQPGLRKLDPDEELFAFLYYMRSYPSKGYKEMEVHFGWSHSSAEASWRWLLRILSHETDSPLAQEIVWPSVEERDAQVAMLIAAGINSAFLPVVAWVDGVKQ